MYCVVVVWCMHRLKVVHVVGKRSRPVPILLTHDMLQCMDVLRDTRGDCGIRDDNDFFFALPGSKGHLRFFDVMRRVAERAGLKRPDLLTCTRMRKHLATMAQVVIVCCHLHVTVVTFQWQTILLMLIG